MMQLNRKYKAEWTDEDGDVLTYTYRRAKRPAAIRLQAELRGVQASVIQAQAAWEKASGGRVPTPDCETCAGKAACCDKCRASRLGDMSAEDRKKYSDGWEAAHAAQAQTVEVLADFFTPYIEAWEGMRDTDGNPVPVTEEYVRDALITFPDFLASVRTSVLAEKKSEGVSGEASAAGLDSESSGPVSNVVNITDTDRSVSTTDVELDTAVAGSKG